MSPTGCAVAIETIIFWKLPQHLRIRITKKNWTERFVVAMTSLLSDKTKEKTKIETLCENSFR